MIIGQAGTLVIALPPSRVVLNRANFLEHRVERRRHQLVHGFRLVALDEIRIVAVAGEELRQFLIGHAASTVGFAIL